MLLLAGRGQTIPYFRQVIMYREIKDLFGKDTPSVKQFKVRLAKLSDEEQSYYHRAALEAAFFDWENMPSRYREFMTDLFTHNWQKTLKYLLHSTVMGSLRFELLDPELLQQVVTLLEGKQEDGYMPSFPHLAFVFMLAFRVDCSIEVYRKRLRTNTLLEEDFWYMLERVRHGNDPGRIDHD